MTIADFHCDLLSYLDEDEKKSAYDNESRASIPLLNAGKVSLQTLAIYTETNKGSYRKGFKQFEIYLNLPNSYSEFNNAIETVLAIENASSICEEEEDLEKVFSRIEQWQKLAGKIAYISLTWNSENRFGGGCYSKAGLKSDGKELLKYLSGKNIAIDLSHTSDRLAADIFNTIDQYQLQLIPIASHSNFRKIASHVRNLPDEIALEIGKRKGLIGLNFVRVFLGNQGTSDFIRHIEHAQSLDLLNHVCFGADFFADHEVPLELEYLKPFYYDEFDSAACYPQLLNFLSLHMPSLDLENIAYKNLSHFLKNL